MVVWLLPGKEKTEGDATVAKVYEPPGLPVILLVLLMLVSPPVLLFALEHRPVLESSDVVQTRTKSLLPMQAGSSSLDWQPTFLGAREIVRYRASFEQNSYLQDALLKLEYRCRQLLWYLYQDPGQLSYKEVAARLQMKVGALGPTRARCLKKLRSLMENRP